MDASDGLSDLWQAEAELAQAEATFAPLFDSPGYHAALRETFGQRSLRAIEQFRTLPDEEKSAIVDALYAAVVLSEDARLLRGEHASKRAMRSHLESITGLDRTTTRRMLALPPRSLWGRVLQFFRDRD